ncbi:hypothetical protein ACFL1X_08635 [Candidatus Hydrogenedentota bacterium]
MRSQREGGLSAITKVKVLSPEIVTVAQCQGFHCLEARIAVAYSMIAQLGIYISEGHGQVVVDITELLDML